MFFSVTEPPRGRPVGGGGVYRKRGYGGLNPHRCSWIIPGILKNMGQTFWCAVKLNEELKLKRELKMNEESKLKREIKKKMWCRNIFYILHSNEYSW
jgi:hypothetical protein